MNIPATLAKCRAEYERQQAIEQAATPGPVRSHDFAPYGCTIYAPDAYPMAGTFSGHGDKWTGANPLGDDKAVANAALFCLSRNINPARLRVAEELMGATDKWLSLKVLRPDCLGMAAALLGVEVEL